MDLRRHLRLMADWNVWAYERTCNIVDQATDADHRRDTGLFFGSIHRTVNHMLLVEKMWRGRLTETPFAVTGLDQELETDRAGLRHCLLESAGWWRPYVDSLSDAELLGDFSYRSLKGDSYTLPRSAIIHTMFTHGAHHRGQVSAVLTQLGLGAPVLDYPYFLAALPKEAVRGL
jgi:uncharacterized damage-inducible protein DinB